MPMIIIEIRNRSGSRTMNGWIPFGLAQQCALPVHEGLIIGLPLPPSNTGCCFASTSSAYTTSIAGGPPQTIRG